MALKFRDMQRESFWDKKDEELGIIGTNNGRVMIEQLEY